MFRHPGIGQVLHWSSRIGDQVLNRELSPAISTNDTEPEVDAVMSGHVIGLLSDMSVASHARAGRKLPLLANHLSVHVYYGRRTSQPARVRAFIDLAVDRLAHEERFVLSGK